MKIQIKPHIYTTMSYDKELAGLMDLSGEDSESEFETLSLTSGRESRDYDEFSEYDNGDNIVIGEARLVLPMRVSTVARALRRRLCVA